jgi:hydrogenase maturation protease
MYFLLLPFPQAGHPPGVSGLLVIGIGNPDCGDDAIGPIVTRLLAGRLPAGVDVLERTGDMLGLLDDWTGRDGVVLIDAAALVTAAGTIHRIDLLCEALPAGVKLASTHAFGVAEAVELARALDRLPGALIAYAIEGATFFPGVTPSPSVMAVAGTVACRVVIEINKLAI